MKHIYKTFLKGQVYMLLEALLICSKTLETAKSATKGNQKNRDYFTKLQKMLNCEEIINGSSLCKKDKEVAKLFYFHDNQYTWETAFSHVYTETSDVDDITKLVNNCKKRIQRAVDNYTSNYIEKQCSK